LQRLEAGGYWNDWEVKIEKLDRGEGLNHLKGMKSWTDQMAMSLDRFSPGIAYQFDGDKLLPIRLYK